MKRHAHRDSWQDRPGLNAVLFLVLLAMLLVAMTAVPPEAYVR